MGVISGGRLRRSKEGWVGYSGGWKVEISHTQDIFWKYVKRLKVWKLIDISTFTTLASCRIPFLARDSDAHGEHGNWVSRSAGKKPPLPSPFYGNIMMTNIPVCAIFRPLSLPLRGTKWKVHQGKDEDRKHCKGEHVRKGLGNLLWATQYSTVDFLIRRRRYLSHAFLTFGAGWMQGYLEGED